MGNGAECEESGIPLGAKTSRPIFAGLAALIVLNSVLSVFVIRADHVPPTHDVLFMSRAAMMLGRAIRFLDPAMWKEFCWVTRDMFYPPLTHFTALPFTLLYSETFDAAAMSIGLYSAIMIMAVFAIGTRLRDEATGLLAATLATISPAMLGFSRVYLVDVPLAAMVATTLAMLFATDRLSSRKFSVGLGVVCGMGLLVKQTFVVYAAPAVALYAGGAFVRAKGRRERTRRALNFALTALAAVLVAGWWYAPRGFAMIVKQNTINALARSLEPDRADLMDFVRLAWDGAGWVIAPLASLGLLFSLRERHHRAQSATLVAALLAPFAFLPMVLVIMTPRYVLPLVPIGAVLAGLALRDMTRFLFAYAAIAVVAISVTQAVVVTSRRPVGPIDDTEIHARFQEYGLLRPQFVGPASDAMADAVRHHHHEGNVIMLLDRPITQMVQSRLYERNPLFPVEGVFERASMGILPDDRDEVPELDRFFDSADTVVVGFENGLDDEATARAVSISPVYTALVFKVWRTHETAFTPAQVVAAGDLRLVVMKRLTR